MYGYPPYGGYTRTNGRRIVEDMSDQEKPERTYNGTGIGIAAGLAVGAAAGQLMWDNIGLGAAAGLAIGLAIGAAFDARKT